MKKIEKYFEYYFFKRNKKQNVIAKQTKIFKIFKFDVSINYKINYYFQKKIRVIFENF